MKRQPARSEPDPTLHPIAVVAERTGLSQDVLRVWERRYGVVRPTRTPGGQRLYSDEDIARLGLLQSAIAGGRGIGQVAGLSVQELTRLVEADAAARMARRESGREAAAPVSDAAADADRTIGEALDLALALDTARLDALLRRASARLGVAPFLELVAAPLLRRVGEEWHAGRLHPAQEHLVSAVVHDIAVATLRAFPIRTDAPRVLIATPAGDRHAVGAALIAAAAAVEGWNVLYLGADLPATDIASAAVAARARLVALSVVFLDEPARVLAELRAVRAALPAAVVLVAGGGGAAALGAELRGAGIHVGRSIADFRGELQRQAPPA